MRRSLAAPSAKLQAPEIFAAAAASQWGSGGPAPWPRPGGLGGDVIAQRAAAGAPPFIVLCRGRLPLPLPATAGGRCFCCRSAPAPSHRPGAALILSQPGRAVLHQGWPCTHLRRGLPCTKLRRTRTGVGACPGPRVPRDLSREAALHRDGGSAPIPSGTAVRLAPLHPSCAGKAASAHPRGSGLACTHPPGPASPGGSPAPLLWVGGGLHRTQPYCPYSGAARGCQPSPIAGDRLLAPASFHGRGEGGKIPNQVSSVLLYFLCVFYHLL